ncbi:MAG: glycosyltransferase [Actinomycetes bacterium]
MKVVIDLRVLSTPAGERGMGRYSRQVVAALANASGIETAALIFPEPHEHLVAELEELGVEILRVNHDWLRPTSWRMSMAITTYLEQKITEWGADVFIDATPFIHPPRVDLGDIPVLAVFYDLIPFFHHRDYLATHEAMKNYTLHARGVARADHILAISDAVARDSINVLSASTDRLSVMYPALDSLYLRGDVQLDASLVPSEPFTVAVTGVHKSKGLKPFLKAYQEARAAGVPHKLVIVLPEAFTLDVVRDWDPALIRDVDFRAEVSELEKVSLQALAEFVVHPSIEEGFGIPLAEAVALGKPTIAADTPLNREITSTGTLSFEFDGGSGLRDAIVRLASDERLLQELRDGSRNDWEVLRPKVNGRIDIATVLQATVAAAAERTSGRRCAISSTAPPEVCGIGDYAAELAASLATLAKVDYFVDSPATPDIIEDINMGVRPLASLPAVQDTYSDVFIQVGGSYGFTGQLAMLASGVLRDPWVTVHDYNMTLGLRTIWAQKIPERSFLVDVVAAEPEEHARFVAGILFDSEDEQTVVDHLQNLPLNSWIFEAAGGVISHLEPPENSVSARFADKVHVFPMGVPDPYAKRYLPAPARSDGTIVIGTLGNVVRTKLIEVLIAASVRVARVNPDLDVKLRIVGPQVDPGYLAELKRLTAKLDARDIVCFTSRIADDQILSELRSWDIGVALRDPIRGGMSAALLRMLAMGMPIVMSDIADWGHVPEGSVLRIPTVASDDVAPEDLLAAELNRLCRDGGARQEFAAASRAAYLEFFRIETMASNYLNVGDTSA